MGNTNVYPSGHCRKTHLHRFLQHTPANALAAAAAPAVVLPAMADDANLDALLAAHAAAAAEAAAADTLDQTAAWDAAAQRCNETYDAIMNARPTDPIAMAKQIRFLILDSTDREDRMLAHIADQLEAMQLAATGTR